MNATTGKKRVMQKRNTNHYIQTDSDKLINEACIKWIRKIDGCLEICTKSNGCNIHAKDRHVICKNNTPESYHYLHDNFK